MVRICTHCLAQFEITDGDLEFYKKISPIFHGKKYFIPPPTHCPTCRLQRRLSFRNERYLYRRKCDMSGKQIISIYSPESPYIVYDQSEWWSDTWDGRDYGRDFDFSRTFSEQLQELYSAVPHVSLYNINTENSYYTNYALNQKNCYMIFGAGNNEDCINGKFIVNCNTVADSLSVYSCELCYEGISSEKCYHCMFFINCRGCSDSLMIEDCLSCRNCIGCFGLRSRQYCIFNQQYSKEEYQSIAAEYTMLDAEKIAFLLQKLSQLKAKLPHRSAHIFNSENCTGDNIYHSKNCFYAFDCTHSEDCKYVAFSPHTKETYDCCFCAPDGDRFCYELCSTVDLEASMSCFLTWYGSDVYYSMECHSCHNIFGCVGLKSQRYCILNTQYSPEEYHKHVSRIIEHMHKTGEWGEYLPASISPFAYNETLAQEYFPLTKEQVEAKNIFPLQKGWKWREQKEPDFSAVTKKIPAQKLPPTIAQIPDDILHWAIICEETGRMFRVVAAELDFYRKMGLPIPRCHPDVRHQKRVQHKICHTLWTRKCAQCQKEITTTYSPERPETVYCEECYLQAVYSW